MTRSTLSSIGKSIQGRELWVLRITDNPDSQEREPEVKCTSILPWLLPEAHAPTLDIGNIHGDETVGRENLIRCAYLRCAHALC